MTSTGHGQRTSDFVQRLRESRLLGILRYCPDEGIECVAEAAKLSGLRFLEVAMNTPGAAGQIRRFCERLDGICEIGAGTVLSVEQAVEATEAGATFLVSPALVLEVQDWAISRDVPTLPGAFTPTEVLAAHRCGAAMVKVFPAKSAGGPGYIRELRGPFHDIPLLACGGVSTDNAQDYLCAGTDALAFGGSVFTASRLNARDAEGIAQAIRALRPGS